MSRRKYLCCTMDGSNHTMIEDIDQLKSLMDSRIIDNMVGKIRAVTQNPDRPMNEADRDKVRRMKAGLPMIYYCGLYTGPGVTRKKEDFVYSRNILIDIDKFDDDDGIPTLQELVRVYESNLQRSGKPLHGRLAMALVSPSGYFRFLIRIPDEETTGDIKRDTEREVPMFGPYAKNIDRGATPLINRPSYTSRWSEVGYIDGELLFGEVQGELLAPPTLEDAAEECSPPPPQPERGGPHHSDGALLLQEYILAHPGLSADLHRQGMRNHSLNKLAFCTRWFFDTEKELCEAISEYSPLTKSEVQSVCHSAWNAPRTNGPSWEVKTLLNGWGGPSPLPLHKGGE